ncbi:MAG: putative metal-dependent phosphoesterase (PHP family) [Promethearchaeota archaeon]|nr:MAG: putative metal-dependent phosphoesterase (PHP family) [Candidatus Lokiarchaeota archaeon]
MTSLKLDLHLHTVYSRDSSIHLQDLLIYTKKIGLDGFAITDHNSFKAYEKIKKFPQAKDLVIIPGNEIETNIGEIIALFIDDQFTWKEPDFFEIVEKIKDHNGLVVIPHPFDFLRNNHLRIKELREKTIKKYIDGVEIMNSRIIFKLCVKRAKKFQEKYNLFETGGSDAHTLKEVGNGYTLLPDLTDRSLEGLKDAFLSHQSISAGKLSNPLVHALSTINKLKK